jgi:uroporphyrinogen-III synthase
MAVKRVLVTRPEPSATETARRLIELGFEPVVLPLTETRALPIDRIPDLAGYDAVVATSSSAIRHAPAELLQAFSRIRLFAVGERTAEAGLKAGFRDVEAGGGDADALADHIMRTIPKGSRLLYLCGRLRTGALAERLREAGLTVTVLEVYDTVPVEHARDAAIAAIGERPIDAALVYSAYGAAMLSQVAARPELAPLLANARLLCISARATEALAPELQLRAEIAQAPDEKALFRLLGAFA